MLFVEDNLRKREQPVLNGLFSRIIYFFLWYAFAVVDDFLHKDCRVTILDFLFLTMGVNEVDF